MVLNVRVRPQGVNAIFKMERGRPTRSGSKFSNLILFYFLMDAMLLTRLWLFEQPVSETTQLYVTYTYAPQGVHFWLTPDRK